MGAQKTPRLVIGLLDEFESSGIVICCMYCRGAEVLSDRNWGMRFTEAITLSSSINLWILLPLSSTHIVVVEYYVALIIYCPYVYGVRSN